MSGVNFLGSASGLPLEELVKTFVKTERDVKIGRINTQKTTLESSLSGVSRLKSALSAFQDAAKKLSGESLSTRKATIVQPTDNKTYIETTVSNRAAAGSFDIKVNNLASGSRFETQDMAFTSATDIVSTTAGTLTFTAGDKSFDIDVSANMTLNELRRKINDSSNNFGVNVNIVNAGGSVGSKLVFTSGITGDGNDLVVSNNNAELDRISTVPTGAAPTMLQKQSAQNAVIEIDGIIATSSSNVFKNAIEDIDITVKAVTPENSNASLDVAYDKEGVEENINAFITSYNALVDQVNSLTKFRTLGSDGKTVTGEGGALAGDSLPRNIMSQLRGILGGSVAGADSGLSTLYALGITMDKNGKLEISTSTEFGSESGKVRFDKALNENFDSIAKVFGSGDGLIKQLDSFITDFNKGGGVIEVREKSLKKQIEDNAKALDAANRYMDNYEQRLRKQYVALDSLLGGMQRTASAVTSQLTNLPGFNTNKS
jgi:flagellar hook-associated protein 2